MIGAKREWDIKYRETPESKYESWRESSDISFESKYYQFLLISMKEEFEDVYYEEGWRYAVFANKHAAPTIITIIKDEKYTKLNVYQEENNSGFTWLFFRDLDLAVETIEKAKLKII